MLQYSYAANYLTANLQRMNGPRNIMNSKQDNSYLPMANIYQSSSKLFFNEFEFSRGV